MAQRYSRQEFLDRLWLEIRSGKPLVMTGAGNGIAAKFIERGGGGILGVYNTGYFRMQGYGSLAGVVSIGGAEEIGFYMGGPEGVSQDQKGPRNAGLNRVDVLRDM